MQEWLQQLDPVAQAALAGCFTWGVTLLGAALVFFARSVHQTLLDIMLGFAAGVMIAASFWSLLAASIEMASAQGMPSWAPPTVGFLLGGVFLRLGDALLPHLHPGKELSALVEPVAAVVGAAAVLAVRPLLPYALAFAAGAMIYVVIEELIPESHREHSRADLSTLGTLGGFTVMMILDVALK